MVAAFNDFYWTIRFPRKLRFQRPPEFEVFYPDGKNRHEWLTRVLQPNFYYSSELHTAFLAIHKPPAGRLLYRIYWFPGEAAASPDPPSPELEAEVRTVRHELLAIAGTRQPNRPLPAKLAHINLHLRIVAQLVAEKWKRATFDPADLDVSLMVLDEPAGQCPLLRLAAVIGKHSDSFWGFTLEEGDGNAGRAYKQNFVRCYDIKLPAFKRQSYINAPSFQHKVLFSVPIVHEKDNRLIFAVLNIGSFEDFPAIFLRLLNNETETRWLVKVAHKYLLPKLLEIIYNK
jgi:hypothetical protein